MQTLYKMKVPKGGFHVIEEDLWFPKEPSWKIKTISYCDKHFLSTRNEFCEMKGSMDVHETVQMPIRNLYF